jgi:ribosome-binding protein aMBF1 (putative translation factor)
MEKTVTVDVYSEVRCDLCGKEEEGVEIKTEYTEAEVGFVCSMQVSICQGCWSEKFRQFEKGA